MKRQELLAQVTDYLGYLKNKVEINNSIRLLDINRVAEDFYCGLLNLVYGYSLVNINIDDRDAASIDLGDEAAKIAIQVTSTKGIKKARETHASFVKGGLDAKYDRLVIVNLREKAAHREDAIGSAGGLQLDTRKDLWDVNDIAGKIAAMSDLAKINEVVVYLSANLNIQQGHSLANEVLTVMKLIEVLSDEETNPDSPQYQQMPNPTDKVYRRFVDHAAFLTSSYTELFAIYGDLLSLVRGRAGLSAMRIRKMQMHLQNHSDRGLTDCGGDPRVAIGRLEDHYGGLLRERGIAHDASAVRFFLIDELTRCNVFPAEVSSVVEPVR